MTKTPWLGEYVWVENTYDGNEEDARCVPLPDEVLSMFRPRHCFLCNITTSNEQSSFTHYESKGHFKKVAQHMREKYNALGSLKSNKEKFCPIKCEVCNIVLTSRVVYFQHYEGKMHSKNVKKRGYEMPPLLFPDERKDNEVSSSTEIALPDFDNPLDFMKNLPPPPPLPKLGTYICSLCGVTSNTKSQMELHNNGARHMKNVSKLADGELRDFYMRNGNCEPCVSDVSSETSVSPPLPEENQIINPFTPGQVTSFSPAVPPPNMMMPPVVMDQGLPPPYLQPSMGQAMPPMIPQMPTSGPLQMDYPSQGSYYPYPQFNNPVDYNNYYWGQQQSQQYNSYPPVPNPQNTTDHRPYHAIEPVTSSEVKEAPVKEATPPDYESCALKPPCDVPFSKAGKTATKSDANKNEEEKTHIITGTVAGITSTGLNDSITDKFNGSSTDRGENEIKDSELSNPSLTTKPNSDEGSAKNGSSDTQNVALMQNDGNRTSIKVFTEFKILGKPTFRGVNKPLLFPDKVSKHTKEYPRISKQKNNKPCEEIPKSIHISEKIMDKSEQVVTGSSNEGALVQEVGSETTDGDPDTTVFGDDEIEGSEAIIELHNVENVASENTLMSQTDVSMNETLGTCETIKAIEGNCSDTEDIGLSMEGESATSAIAVSTVNEEIENQIVVETPKNANVLEMTEPHDLPEPASSQSEESSTLKMCPTIDGADRSKSEHPYLKLDDSVPFEQFESVTSNNEGSKTAVEGTKADSTLKSDGEIFTTSHIVEDKVKSPALKLPNEVNSRAKTPVDASKKSKSLDKKEHTGSNRKSSSYRKSRDRSRSPRKQRSRRSLSRSQSSERSPKRFEGRRQQNFGYRNYQNYYGHYRNWRNNRNSQFRGSNYWNNSYWNQDYNRDRGTRRCEERRDSDRKRSRWVERERDRSRMKKKSSSSRRRTSDSSDYSTRSSKSSQSRSSSRSTSNSSRYSKSSSASICKSVDSKEVKSKSIKRALPISPKNKELHVKDTDKLKEKKANSIEPEFCSSEVDTKKMQETKKVCGVAENKSVQPLEMEITPLSQNNSKSPEVSASKITVPSFELEASRREPMKVAPVEPLNTSKHENQCPAINQDKEKEESLNNLLRQVVLIRSKLLSDENKSSKKKKNKKKRKRKSKKMKRRRSPSSSSYDSSSSSSSSSTTSSSSSPSIPESLLQTLLKLKKEPPESPKTTSGFSASFPAPLVPIKSERSSPPPQEKNDKKTKKKRKKKTKKSKESSLYKELPRFSLSPYVTPSGMYYCKYCNMTTESGEVFIKHLHSEKHKLHFKSSRK